MSDDLRDEIEALNSIYGDDTLRPSPPNYILALPGGPGATSLTLRFPDSYPDVPPEVLGTHSAGENAPRGAGARDLAVFRDAVANVYQPGAVCLFDAVEEFSRLLEEHAGAEPSPPPPPPEKDEGKEEHGTRPAPLAEEPPWVVSDPFVELKSVFLARAAPVASPAQAAGYVQHLLATDKKVRAATHNMTAWRVRGPNGTSFQDCDDDGETAAGSRLLHLMQLMDLWDVMVVVSRWYGGQKLGPRRFALINSAARDAFVKAGWVEEAGQGKKKGHGK
ncbi:RWD domain-containing protein [Colletotrichum graminicola]|uniref:RWD domain-containing protein n=1 Tax=Colletotrichum graminicola (strain M1.001 / M2 / FGSC 10212) TaxID=645133 RepID=E3QG17_COLGM|nr:RWD domain-containing protein [Colletotrichum graminicola M1.001]EFQ29852.1 RWD domain-containing protein [Colletotrichum graminicola M1.001]WDK12330.1 RWD domain-containing protein [Colletotrichum graminicola]